ncbi:unnamed protein product [Effrenium voratum]|nr:unnamed protein product [Effrenium voratum]|mmetsp:Transcript_114185/g.271797  ORF Transcript_114185/g.271797 Transcript_114185/m.271797 type:complete len:340 (-) Transcript_114185:67-1086(-)
MTSRLLGVGLLAAALSPGLLFSVVVRSPSRTAPAAPSAQRLAAGGGGVAPSVAVCGVVVVLAASRGNARKKCSRKAGIMGSLDDLKKEEEEEKEMQEKGKSQEYGTKSSDEGDKLKAFFDQDIDISELEEYAKQYAEDAADTSKRQIAYKLYPSKQYVLYLAKKNAIKTWAKDGNQGGLEVQIAVLTERIRNMVLHMREFRRDYKCRMKLTSLVCRRRRYLDKLAAKNLDAYMKIREELKIRHVYRMEALKNRLPAYVYAVKDRLHRPGRKTLNRLKKTKALFTRRLARQLRQGRERKVIHRTKKKLDSREWMTRPYDEVRAWERNKDLGNYLDPLNMP